MNKKVGVDMGGTWAGVVDEGANGGRINRFVKHPTPSNWDGLVNILAPYAREDIEGFGIAIAFRIPLAEFIGFVTIVEGRKPAVRFEAARQKFAAQEIGAIAWQTKHDGIREGMNRRIPRHLIGDDHVKIVCTSAI